jgi:hypothetical protein
MVKISGAIEALKDYMAETLAGKIDDFMSVWIDPFSARRDTAVILPDSAEPGNDATVIIHALAIIVINDARNALIARQMEICDTLLEELHEGKNIGSVYRAVFRGVDFFEPAPNSPNTGVVQINIDFITDILG